MPKPQPKIKSQVLPHPPSIPISQQDLYRSMSEGTDFLRKHSKPVTGTTYRAHVSRDAFESFTAGYTPEQKEFALKYIYIHHY